MLARMRNLAFAAAAGLLAFAPLAHAADTLIISTGLGQPHLWVAQHMNPFADAIEKGSNGEITFTRFYSGELTSVGRELDGLTSGTIDVAAPLLAPYHEGRFPLSDVTQLPAYGTTSPMVTRAFQKLLDSDVKLSNGKTFYEYEIADKGIRVWALGATAPYSISTTSKVLKEPEDFKGVPLRAGAALHTIVVEKLGATPVTLPGPQAYEALSRGTIEGIIIAISDWPSYSIEQLLRHTITDVSIGHWESYLAISNEAWDGLTDEQKKLFDETARKIALQNAQVWEDNVEVVKKKSMEEYNGQFTPIGQLSPAMQQHVAKAAADTWKTWIEKTEAAGHPARDTAKLYAQFIIEEGGKLPEGVAEYLGL
ncbi:TRAP transporter substrate-binding protein DctP [Rhodoligotrophos defluvii]|uniref:TRAP transporter substrate-binding protein DctP n=1 Tax=Rhodoligotrophos defluvii TaxID=2561934 RepID=UPI00195F4546|nr:TRAP transporter substrate-binding protein DctP [Rhodoligotrophos defluvii]